MKIKYNKKAGEKINRRNTLELYNNIEYKVFNNYNICSLLRSGCGVGMRANHLSYKYWCQW